MESHAAPETGIDTEHDGPLTPKEQAFAQAGLTARGYRTHAQIADALSISRSLVSKLLSGQRAATRRTRRDLVEILRAPAPGQGGGTVSAFPGAPGSAPTSTVDLAERQGVALRPLPVYRANEAMPAAPPMTAWPPPELVARLTNGFGVQVTSDTLAGYRLPNGTRLERGDVVWVSTFDLEQGWLRAGAGQLVAVLVDFPDKPNEPAGRRLVLRVYGGTPAAPRLALQRGSEPAPREASSQEHTLLGVAVYVVRGYSLNGSPTHDARPAPAPVR